MVAHNMQTYFFKTSKGGKVSLQDKHYNCMYCNHMHVIMCTTSVTCFYLEEGHRTTHSTRGKYVRHDHRRWEPWGPPKSLPVIWGFPIKLQCWDSLIIPFTKMSTRKTPTAFQLPSLAQAVITNYHRWGGLSNYFSRFWRWESLRSRSRLADLVSGEDILSGLQMAIFSLHSYMVERRERRPPLSYLFL